MSLPTSNYSTGATGQAGTEISVIICTYNREKYLPPLLESIVSQDYPHERYEIVLINNNSADRTEQVCRQFTQSHPDVRFLYFVETQQGLSFARNRGIAESRGDLLLYVDDDATVFPNYLQAYSRFFRIHPEIMAAGGPIIPHYEGTPPAWLTYFTQELLTGYLYRGDKPGVFTHGKYPGGGNACYRKTFFTQFGLFNVELGRKGKNLIGAEEKDLFSRFLAAGNKIGYVPEAGIYHYIPPEKLTREHLIRLSYSIGVSERIRTRSVSSSAYFKRIFSESVKWGATVVLFLGYLIRFQYAKGEKLLEFRYRVTRGLLGWKAKN
ncbi:MAG: glycosyltransferase family 2 protein [Dysgonamonadaceae bacterium]|jgi:glycosyltransferase involved in cell wall biosynthesis|nr:glycosyltransferase family 2 protein [Dysgonamonadaceae bacterium]